MTGPRAYPPESDDGCAAVLFLAVIAGLGPMALLVLPILIVLWFLGVLLQEGLRALRDWAVGEPQRPGHP